MSNCILLSLPEDLEKEIKSWAKENVHPDDLCGIDGKGFEGSPHITAAYGIDDPDVFGSVTKALAGTQPIKAKLGKVRFFTDPEKDYHVLKIDVLPGDIEALHEKIVSNVSMYDPTYEYHPHVTLAYVKPGACQELDGADAFDGKDVDITSCLVMTEDHDPKRVYFDKDNNIGDNCVKQ